MYCYKANFVLVNVDKNLVVGQNPLPFGQFPNFNWRQYCSASRLLHAVLAAMRTLPPDCEVLPCSPLSRAPQY